jgi:hypothetical protein
MDVLPAHEVTPVINPVTVAAQAEMLQGMEAGDGIVVLHPGKIPIHKIGLAETDIGDGALQIPDIQHFDLPKRGHMGHEAVNSGTDVDMSDGIIMKYPARHQQILMKIMACRRTALLASVLQARIESPKGKIRRSRLAPDLPIFP